MSHRQQMRQELRQRMRQVHRQRMRQVRQEDGLRCRRRGLWLRSAGCKIQVGEKEEGEEEEEEHDGQEE